MSQTSSPSGPLSSQRCAAIFCYILRQTSEHQIFPHSVHSSRPRRKTILLIFPCSGIRRQGCKGPAPQRRQRWWCSGGRTVWRRRWSDRRRRTGRRSRGEEGRGEGGERRGYGLRTVRLDKPPFCFRGFFFWESEGWMWMDDDGLAEDSCGRTAWTWPAQID